MPGCTQIGPLTLRPFNVISTMSPFGTPSSRAVLRLTSTALSQVILVIGSGNSCIQPLFAITAVVHLCVAEENDFEVGCGRRGDILIPGMAEWTAGTTILDAEPARNPLNKNFFHTFFRIVANVVRTMS